MPTSFLPGTVLRSSGEWPCTSALGLVTRKYSADKSNDSPLSKATVSVLRSLCNRSSVGQGRDWVKALLTGNAALISSRGHAIHFRHGEDNQDIWKSVGAAPPRRHA